jgi:hypothetical protein
MSVAPTSDKKRRASVLPAVVLEDLEEFEVGSLNWVELNESNKTVENEKMKAQAIVQAAKRREAAQPSLAPVAESGLLTRTKLLGGIRRASVITNSGLQTTKKPVEANSSVNRARVLGNIRRASLISNSGLKPTAAATPTEQ